MLTVVMECRDQEPELAQTLAVLVAGAVEGLVSDVIVLDHGSTDGSSRVADAAGCRFYVQWDMNDVLRAARGEWLLLVEPGARPLSGWIEAIGDYVSVNKSPARFSPSRSHRRPFYQRIVRGRPPLEDGLLLPKSQAIAVSWPGMRLDQFALRQKPRRLSCEIIPSWVVRQQGRG
jgi:glycosyltransferase involved in cell wall biosynthesis